MSNRVSDQALTSNRERTRNSNRQNRIKALRLLGGICKRCGFDDPRALQIDHIQGDGKNEGPVVLRMVQAHPEKYQLLCANCNWIKRSEKHEYRTRRVGPSVLNWMDLFEESH